jgi:hypothetical protein
VDRGIDSLQGLGLQAMFGYVKPLAVARFMLNFGHTNQEASVEVDVMSVHIFRSCEKGIQTGLKRGKPECGIHPVPLRLGTSIPRAETT